MGRLLDLILGQEDENEKYDFGDQKIIRCKRCGQAYFLPREADDWAHHWCVPAMHMHEEYKSGPKGYQ